MPVQRCKQLHDEWKSADAAGELPMVAHAKKPICSQLTPLGEEAEWLAEAIYGERVLPYIAHFKDMHGVADVDAAQWAAFRHHQG